jgi:hypothetical protein
VDRRLAKFRQLLQATTEATATAATATAAAGAAATNTAEKNRPITPNDLEALWDVVSGQIAIVDAAFASLPSGSANRS